MSEISQLVFYGEILPGHDAETVKAKLAELLKLPAEQIPAVFSGRKVVLRKSLPSEQGPSYLARLEKIGVKALVEPLAAAATPPAAPVMPAAAVTEPPVGAPSASHSAPLAALPQPMPSVPSSASPIPAAAAAIVVQAATAEEMDCPKCGERQPRRTLCRACSTDMKRFAEAQQEAELQAREERMQTRETERGGSGRLASTAAIDEERESFSIFGLDFSGRIGRVNYLVAGWFVFAIMMLALWLAAKTAIWALAAVGIIVAIVFSFRFAILRCHDANWNGWLSLILCIPYVGGLFGLILLIMPGTRGGNNYGAATHRVGWLPGLGMLVACGVSAALFAGEAMTAYGAYLNKTGGAARQTQRAPGTGAAASDGVLIYTTATECDACVLAKRYLRDHGIRYTEKMVEQNEDHLRELFARGGRDVPYIVVGDRSMTGYDPEQLRQLLGDRI